MRTYRDYVSSCRVIFPIVDTPFGSCEDAIIPRDILQLEFHFADRRQFSAQREMAFHKVVHNFDALQDIF